MSTDPNKKIKFIIPLNRLIFRLVPFQNYAYVNLVNDNQPFLTRPFKTGGHLKRINISLDSGLLAKIDHLAKIYGKNRSEFLADTARQMLT